MFMRLKVVHAVFIVAFARGAIPKLHLWVVLFGFIAYRASVNSGRSLLRKRPEGFSPLIGRTPLARGCKDFAAEKEEIISDGDQGCHLTGKRRGQDGKCNKRPVQ